MGARRPLANSRLLAITRVGAKISDGDANQEKPVCKFLLRQEKACIDNGGHVGVWCSLQPAVAPRRIRNGKEGCESRCKQLVINKQEAESQIVAEMFSLDQQTSNASGGAQDYKVHAIIGCQSLNCDGYKTDPQYANHDCNRHYIAGNQQAYDDLVNNNPVSTAIAGTGMVGYSLLRAVSNHGMKHP
jgi:hypothetical protein